MGYSHYWRTPRELSEKEFEQFSKDCAKIVDYCQQEMGIDIGDWAGEGSAIIDKDTIGFNGSSQQRKGVWTTDEQILIPWPAPLASLTEVSADPIAKKTSGHWFAGDLVSQRVAPLNNETGYGSGDYEYFVVNRVLAIGFMPNAKGLFFNCVKTAYRPYDLPVTACLIALKHHFPDCEVDSDGEEKDWLDGMMLCNNLLWYGMDFKLDE